MFFVAYIKTSKKRSVENKNETIMKNNSNYHALIIFIIIIILCLYIFKSCHTFDENLLFLEKCMKKVDRGHSNNILEYTYTNNFVSQN